MARLRLWREAAWLASCALPLAAWYAYHYAKTGFLFGNPEFLRYNAQANLDPLRFLAAFGHRLLHLTAHMNLFVPVGMALAALLLDAASGSPASTAPSELRSGIAHRRAAPHLSAAAGQRALLQRSGRRAAHPLSAAHVSAGAAGWPSPPLSPRSRLAGVWPSSPPRLSSWGSSSIRPTALPRKTIWPMRASSASHQAGIAQLEAALPRLDRALRLAGHRRADPPRAGLRSRSPSPSTASRTLPPPQIARAAQEPENYSTALVFSTKYDPPSPLLTLGRWERGAGRALLRPASRLAARSRSPSSSTATWSGSSKTRACGSRSSASTASTMRGWRAGSRRSLFPDP